MNINSLQPGMTVFWPLRRRMGNTTLRTTYIQAVTVVSVDLDRKTVRARVNGRECTYGERHVRSWRSQRPMLVGSITGVQRLATRAEIKAMNDAKAASEP